MQLFVTISHIMLCIVLILIILLQPGKDSAAIFGGGQGGNKMYGVRSNANPLSRATTTIAVLFMVTSITLAWYSSASAQDDSGLKDAINKQLKIVNPKDITFEVQKVYGISPFALVKDPKSMLGAPPMTPSEIKDGQLQGNQQPLNASGIDSGKAKSDTNAIPPSAPAGTPDSQQKNAASTPVDEGTQKTTETKDKGNTDQPK